MRVFGRLLVVVSFAAGAFAAASAYHVPLDGRDETLLGLTMLDGSPAAPAAKKGESITPESLAALRRAATDSGRLGYARVKEFSLRRWRLAWLFALSAAGVVAGSLLARRRPKAITSGSAAAGGSTEQLLAGISQRVAGLRANLGQQTDSAERVARIIFVVGDLQQQDIPAWLATQPGLVARVGLGRAAEILDRFAAAERQLNRAWSAASDQCESEAMQCLDRADELLRETAERLAANTA